MSFVNRKFFGLVALLVLLGAMFAPQMLAQTNYGSVRGLAKDSQGAVIPDAEVTLTNVGTKIVRTAKTNGAGEYSFPSATPGDYIVTVTLKGFKTFKEPTTVTVGGEATVDASLQVGSTGETVEVQTSEPLIDTASASAGQNFTSQQLTELPNLGRNPFVFEKLDNNVTPVGDPRYVRAEDQSGSSAVSIAGAPIGSNSYVVDGIPTSTSSGGVTFIPSPEAVSSAKTQANTYDAEVGRTGGGVGNATLKSGTSSYHGVLYGETRQTNWSADSWSNKHTPLVLNGVSQPTTPRPDVTTYLYAGAFGGPVPFSNKVKYLKDTFFYITEEGYRQAQPLTGSGSLIVPTALEAAGNFTGDFGASAATAAPVTGNPGGKGNTYLYDPTSPFVNGSRSLALVGQLNGLPSQNVVPASYINPIGSWIVNNAYPGATFAPSSVASLAAYGTPNSTRADDFKTRSDMYSGKLDHVFFPWWTSNVSYVHLATQEPSGDFYGNKGNYSSDGRLVRFNDATSFYNVFTLNPTTIATVGYGFNRYYSVTFPYGLGFNLTNGFGGAGFPTSFVSQVQSQFGGKGTFPTISSVSTGAAGSLASLGTGYGGRSIPSATHNFVLGIQKTVGKQNLKAGYVYRALHVASNPLGANPSFTFPGNFTTIDGKSATTSVATTSGAISGTGSGIADLLMGLPDSASVGVNQGSFNEVANYHALYFQDDFRANDKLTVNLGLRYEYELGEREQNNQLTVGFDRNVSFSDPNTGTLFHGGLAYAGQNGYPIHTANQSHTKFSPRVGIAYEPRKGTVVQAGFGVFYAPEAVSAFTSGFTQGTAYTPGTGGNISAAISSSQLGNGTANFLNSPFPTGLVQPSGNSLGVQTNLGTTISVVDFARRDPLVEQYSVRVEHQLPWATTLTLGYAGAHAKNFPLSVNINQLPDGVFAQLRASAAGGATTDYSKSTGLANPYYYPTVSNAAGATYATGSITASNSVAAGQLLLPYPQYSTVTLSESVGYSLYNALNVKVQKQAAKGLTVLFTYTLASNWDNLYSGGSTLNGTNGPADNYNLKGEYSRAVNDIPNRYAAGITYVIPVGRGQTFFNGMPKLLDYVLGGYSIDSIITRQDGGPLAVTQSTDYSTTYGVTGFGGTIRPTFVPGVNPCYSGSPQSRSGYAGTGLYFNPAAFTGTPAYAYGNVPRSLPCKGPGLSDMDINIFKTFALGEHVKIKFLAEALNATNTTQFGLASTALSTLTKPSAPGIAPTLQASGTTGTLTQLNYSRFIQLGGRITF